MSSSIAGQNVTAPQMRWISFDFCCQKLTPAPELIILSSLYCQKEEASCGAQSISSNVDVQSKEKKWHEIFLGVASNDCLGQVANLRWHRWNVFLIFFSGVGISTGFFFTYKPNCWKDLWWMELHMTGISALLQNLVAQLLNRMGQDGSWHCFSKFHPNFKHASLWQCEVTMPIFKSLGCLGLVVAVSCCWLN